MTLCITRSGRWRRTPGSTWSQRGEVDRGDTMEGTGIIIIKEAVVVVVEDIIMIGHSTIIITVAMEEEETITTGVEDMGTGRITTKEAVVEEEEVIITEIGTIMIATTISRSSNARLDRRVIVRGMDTIDGITIG